MQLIDFKCITFEIGIIYSKDKIGFKMTPLSFIGVVYARTQQSFLKKVFRILRKIKFNQYCVNSFGIFSCFLRDFKKCYYMLKMMGEFI